MNYQETLACYTEQRELLLRGDVTIEKQELLCTALELLNMQCGEPIKLIIDSFGGDSNAARLLFDAVGASHAPVHAEVLKAHSAGFIILQACDIRRGRPNSTFLFHGGNTTLRREDPRAMEEFRRESQWQDDFLHRLAKRSGQKLGDIRKWSLHDARFLADEALEKGFIDEIIKPSR